MKVSAKKTSAHAGKVAFIALGFFCAFSLCIQSGLQADLQAGDIKKMLIRLALVAFISLALAWRLRNMQLGSALGLRRSLFSLFFLFVLFAPLLGQFSFLGKSIKDVTVQLAGERQGMLHQVVHVVRLFPEAYQKYMDQHFKVPGWYVQLNALIKVHVFDFSPNNNITKGQNGFYFEGMGSSRVEKDLVETFDNIADYMGQIPFTEEELRQWKITLEERSYWLKTRGADYVFVLAPTKAFVYPEYLPKAIQNVRGDSRYAQLSQYLQKYADIHFIDLLPPLLEAKKKKADSLLFYKTDFHWNFYGAFIAYQTMLERMQGFFPLYRFDVPQINDFDLKINEHWAHERFMYMLGLPLTWHRNEHHVTMIPKKGGLYEAAKDLPPDGIYDVYPPVRKLTAPDGTSMEARLIFNPAAPIPSIVLLGDSFLEKCVYFFSANAKRVLNFRTVVNFPLEVFHFEHPSIVIQEILNMFILRPPPDNPDQMKLEYYKNKFLALRSKSLLNKTWGAAGDDSALPKEVPLSQLTQPKTYEVRSTMLRLEAETTGQLQIRLLDGMGKAVITQVVPLTQGINTVYFGLPASSVALVELKPQSQRFGVHLLELEVRTDNPIP